MVNYACAFKQPELGKFFEWIIIVVIDVMIFITIMQITDKVLFSSFIIEYNC